MSFSNFILKLGEKKKKENKATLKYFNLQSNYKNIYILYYKNNLFNFSFLNIFLLLFLIKFCEYIEIIDYICDDSF